MRCPRFLVSEGRCAARMHAWQSRTHVALCGRCTAGRAYRTIGDDDMLEGGQKQEI